MTAFEIVSSISVTHSNVSSALPPFKQSRRARRALGSCYPVPFLQLLGSLGAQAEQPQRSRPTPSRRLGLQNSGLDDFGNYFWQTVYMDDPDLSVGGMSLGGSALETDLLIEGGGRVNF